MNSSLKLGIGNGSLFKSVQWCLNQIGIPCNDMGRKIQRATGHSLISEIYTSRPQHLVEYLRRGVVDFVIMGKDMLLEYSKRNDEFTVITDLAISKTTTNQHVRVVLFSHDDSVQEIKDVPLNSTILSEYPDITKRIFAKVGIPVTITPSSGGTEGPVALKLYDFGVCVTETESSIRENKLHIVETIMDAPVVFAIKSKSNEQLVNSIGKMMQGVLKYQEAFSLKMNVGDSNRNAVINLLPALKSPTVNALADDKNFAIEAIVPAKDLATLILSLENAGASGFIWSKLDGVMP